MPKRPCPFQSSHAPQKKVHVGPNKLAPESSYHREIHVKTLRKLYLGANKCSSPAISPSTSCPCTCGQDCTSMSSLTCSQALQSFSENKMTPLDGSRYRQLTIGSQGQLVFASSQQVSASFHLIQSTVPSCSFCDQSLPCEQSRRLCLNCGDLYCVNCWRPGFNANGETNLCLACAK